MSENQAHPKHVDPLTLSPGEARKIARDLLQPGNGPQVRIAFGGNVVFDPLFDFLRVQLACDGVSASFHEMQYAQAMQGMLDPDSDLRRFEPDFLFLHFEIDELLSGLCQRREFGSARARASAVGEILETVSNMAHAALSATHAVILLSNFVEQGYDGLGLADWRSEFGEREFFAKLNLGLAQRFRSEPRLQIVDVASLTARFGSSRARDLRLYLLAKVAWHDSFLPWLAEELARHVKAALGRVRKCLVVDLDNTLWGGVLGEDGPHGVRVGIGDATSEAHHRLQQKILAIKERGVLLAICSKNDPDEVARLFRIRSDMPLKAHDFACMQIGWQRKDHCLQRIAEELNIGTASLVFLDDNPAELELIRTSLPEVECVLVPGDTARLAACLDRVHSLDRAIITAEDQDKSAQYQAQSVREAVRREYADLSEYLRSLGTTIEIQPLTRDLVGRAHQLFAKTNQFNVTGRRYTLGEVSSLSIEDDSRIALIVNAKDRFGELGWIAALVISTPQHSVAHLENLVISCRALGRGMEVAILNSLKSICFEMNDFSGLTAEFRPGKKNSQVGDIFDDAGFAEVDRGADEVRRYSLSREQSVPIPCDWIDVRVRNIRSTRGNANVSAGFPSGIADRA
jgi:FkbH-like protein